VTARGKFTHYKVLLMPLSDDGEKVNMIYGIQDFVKGSMS
jgi:hypothetical protein